MGGRRRGALKKNTAPEEPSGTGSPTQRRCCIWLKQERKVGRREKAKGGVKGKRGCEDFSMWGRGRLNSLARKKEGPGRALVGGVVSR